MNISPKRILQALSLAIFIFMMYTALQVLSYTADPLEMFAGVVFIAFGVLLAAVAYAVSRRMK